MLFFTVSGAVRFLRENMFRFICVLLGSGSFVCFPGICRLSFPGNVSWKKCREKKITGKNDGENGGKKWGEEKSQYKKLQEKKSREESNGIKIKGKKLPEKNRGEKVAGKIPYWNLSNSNKRKKVWKSRSFAYRLFMGYATLGLTNELTIGRYLLSYQGS